MFWNFLKKKPSAEQPPKTVAKSPLVTPEPSPVLKITTQVPINYLKRLIPIGQLPTGELQQLEIRIAHFKPGAIIFHRGELTELLPYIAKGKVYLETADGQGYEITTQTFKALYPLSSEQQHQMTAIAKSEVSIIYVPNTALQRSHQHQINPLLEQDEAHSHLRQNFFFNAFCDYFKKGKLVVPTLPDIAIRLRTAMQKDISISDAVKIVNMDPVVASRLIQIVNSPMYRATVPISNCHDAVNRLGLTITRNLVTGISMRNLYQSKHKQISDQIHNQWLQSIRVSSISQTLAASTRKANPDEALLAGLIHNIGAIPVLIFADSLPDTAYSLEDIELCIAATQSHIGAEILKRWQFPETLLNIPMQVENWYYDSGKQLTLSDIVLLAKFHSQLGTVARQKLPPINTLPAFQKLGDNTLTADMSLQLLHNAKQQISETMNLFTA